MLTYTEFVPTFADRSAWTLPKVLRQRAQSHADRVYLDAPDHSLTMTYREIHDTAERIASSLLRRGHLPGDRMVVMMANCPEYILAWLGSSLAGMAEVPINSAYRGTFFEHQVRTVEASAAVVSIELAQIFVGSASALSLIHI